MKKRPYLPLLADMVFSCIRKKLLVAGSVGKGMAVLTLHQ